jgi:hypothetical protein
MFSEMAENIARVSAWDGGVTRVHFTAEDLARTRLCTAPAPLLDLIPLTGCWHPPRHRRPRRAAPR